jgi:hypothetical protein
MMRRVVLVVMIFDTDSEVSWRALYQRSSLVSSIGLIVGWPCAVCGVRRSYRPHVPLLRVRRDVLVVMIFDMDLRVCWRALSAAFVAWIVRVDWP